jgi:hypothetical protein
MQKSDLYKGYALMIIVGVFSLSNLTNFSEYNYLSLGNSLLGLIGIGAFFLKRHWYKRCIWIWALAQAVIIEPIFDCSQFLSLKFGITLRNGSDTVSLNYNIMATLYFILFPFLMPANRKEVKQIANSIATEFANEQADPFSS